MWEILIVIIIIALCAFYVGRRFYRQFKKASGSDQPSDCGGDCSCCSSNKGLKKRQHPEK